MRIAVIGPQNTGKSTFVEDFLKEFSHYKTTNKTYRDVVREKNLKINQLTSAESQREIRDFMCSEIIENKEHNIIFDRCLIDNFVYTTLGYEQGEISKKFVDESEEVMKDSLKYVDLYLFIPTSVSVPLVCDDQRDIDTTYIDATNNCFLRVLFGLIKKDHINVKVISGNRLERIKQVKKLI